MKYTIIIVFANHVHVDTINRNCALHLSYIFSETAFLTFFLYSRWGRWKDILKHGRFKKQLTEWDVESICRALLSYCLVHYRGDDKIKSFMWDLIAPTEDGQTKELQNHLGEL